MYQRDGIGILGGDAMVSLQCCDNVTSWLRDCSLVLYLWNQVAWSFGGVMGGGQRCFVMLPHAPCI
jgi:hypothetical protein